MAIIRSKIARQLLAEGGSPRRKGFMFGSGKGSTAESMSEAAFSPDTFSGFSGDYGGFSSPAGGSGPAPDSDPNTMDDTADVNLGLDVSRQPAFTPPDPDDDRGFFAALSNPRKALSIRYIENELDRRKNFDKTLAGKLGFGPNEKPFDDKFLTRTQELEAALNLAQRGIDVTDIIQKGRPGYNPDREGDSEPMIKLRAPITEKIEEKPKSEFDDILKFYGARFARGGSTGFEGSPEMGGRGTEETYGFDQSGPAGDSGDDGGPPTVMGGGTEPPMLSGGRGIDVGALERQGLTPAEIATVFNDYYGLDTGPTVAGPLGTAPGGLMGTGVATFGQVPGRLLGTTGTKGTQPTELETRQKDLEEIGKSISDPGSLFGRALTDITTNRDALKEALKEYGGPRFEDGGDVRQEYGLGSIVKKIGKTVKKVVKSPVGKAALAFAAYKYGPGFLSGKGLGMGKATSFKDLIFMGKDANVNPFRLIGIPTLLSGLLTKDPKDETILYDEEQSDPAVARTLEFYGGPRRFAAEGGMMEQDEMLDLGGNEMDLRGGGFVPLGEYEKKDDVPARLSKNEFVFTADAVRAAGGGSVDKGADVMYKTMKTLENKVA